MGLLKIGRYMESLIHDLKCRCSLSETLDLVLSEF